MAVYVCDDSNSLTITYDENRALVTLPTGPTIARRDRVQPSR